MLKLLELLPEQTYCATMTKLNVTDTNKEISYFSKKVQYIIIYLNISTSLMFLYSILSVFLLPV